MGDASAPPPPPPPPPGGQLVLPLFSWASNPRPPAAQPPPISYLRLPPATGGKLAAAAAPTTDEQVRVLAATKEAELESVFDFYNSIPPVTIDNYGEQTLCAKYDNVRDYALDDDMDKENETQQVLAYGSCSSDDEDYDLEKEDNEFRTKIAEMKKARLDKELHCEGDTDVEDLYDCTVDLDEYNIEEVAMFGVQDVGMLSDPPTEDDGHEPVQESEEEIEDGAPLATKKRRRPRRLEKQRLEFDEKNIKDTSQFVKGLCFTNGQQFRNALKTFHIVQGRDYNYIKNKSDRIKVKCSQPTCNFYIMASKIAGENTFMIREIIEPHICGITRESSRISSNWLSNNYEDFFRSDPDWKVDAFMDCAKRDLNYEITRSMAYRAKRRASEKVLGNHKRQYNRLRDYMQTLINKNPGSKAIVRTDPRVDQRLNPMFSGLFISLYAQKQGFLDGCRPFIGLDGCFVKLANGAQVLAASARDGNNNMYPLAIGVVGVEDLDNWTWFLQVLHSHIGGGEEHGGWVIMSDRQKGLMAAVKEVSHRYCKRHLYANFCTAGFSGKPLKEEFNNAVYAYTEPQYTQAMEAMKKLNPKAWKWLHDVGKEHFSRHAFSPRSKTDLVVNNLSEIFNKYILNDRDKPIVTMLEAIRTRVMTRMHLKREGAKVARWNITPIMAEKLEIEKHNSRFCTAYQAAVGIWQVTSSETTCEVNLLNHTCTCYRWDLTGIPCKHAVAAIFKAKEIPENYVHPWLKKECYKKAYEHVIYPVPGEKYWVKTRSLDIDPPKFRKLPGRPKKKRRPSAEEEPNVPATNRARKGSVSCGNCGKSGHNVKTCSKRLRPEIALRVRNHVPNPSAYGQGTSTRGRGNTTTRGGGNFGGTCRGREDGGGGNTGGTGRGDGGGAGWNRWFS